LAAKRKEAAAAKQEKQEHHNALFEPKKRMAAAAEPEASPEAAAKKKSKLGRPPGSADSKKRVAPDAATVAEGAAHGSGGGPRSRAPAGQFIPEEMRKSQAVGDLRDRRSEGVEQSRRLSTDIETKLQGIALDDAGAIAEFAMLLLSPASGSGDSIDSAVSKFCKSDSQAAEIEGLRCQLRAKDDHIMELEARLDDGQLGAITTRYPPAARDIYVCLHRRYLTNSRHAQATR
jgi:hypothetical protein